MPIWLRTFTFNKINEHYIKENEEIKKSQGKSSKGKSLTTDGKVTSPEFLKNTKSQPPTTPSYTTKASRK